MRQLPASVSAGCSLSPSPSPSRASRPRVTHRSADDFRIVEPDPDRMRQAAGRDRQEPGARRATAIMQMEKITYRSRVGDLDIPAFVFQPLKLRGAKGHPALVWVHENIRGHLYEHYIPYIREATAKGYVVIAPEYRGSIGYGQAFYDAIDYGGTEVDDVVTAVDVLKTQVPDVDPDADRHHRLEPRRADHAARRSSAIRRRSRRRSRWCRSRTCFSVSRGRGSNGSARLIDPQNRFGGSPSERHDVYQERSPLFQRRQAADSAATSAWRSNDEDVNIEEEHAAGRRAAGAQAGARRDEGVREPARRPPVRSARRSDRRGSPRTRASSASRGAGLDVSRREAGARRAAADVAPHVDAVR